jgi:hypothetical protein
MSDEVWYKKAGALMRAFDDVLDAINALPTFNEQCDAIKALNRHLFMNSKMLSLIEEAVEWKDTIAELQAKSNIIKIAKEKVEQDLIVDYVEKHFGKAADQ